MPLLADFTRPIRPIPDINVRKLTWSRKSAKSLQELEKHDRLVLFTPVVPPYETTRHVTPANAQDPFESLGRALNQHHARVSHVPFVPRIGFTDTHRDWIMQSQAKVIVVVNCEPAGLETAAAGASLANQKTFAVNVAEAIRNVQIGDDDRILVLVYCGSPDGALQESYQIVLQSNTYTALNLEQLAHILFGTSG